MNTKSNGQKVISDKKRKVLRCLSMIFASLGAVAAIGFFVYPFIKMILIYQVEGVQEQAAFNRIVIPLVINNWLRAFLCCCISGAGVGVTMYYTKKNGSSEGENDD